MLIDGGEPSPLWVEPSPGQMVPDFLRTLAKHEPESEPASSVPPWLLLQVLARVPALTSLSGGR